ncbi:MAG: GxxExxY protein [Candidatus Sungbacteria bacterium]|uniref:GxxExxY protein n=1 Tax=Candidatus Sungiibacteriota bacterium TaxID=2750080 RepID=A0A933DRV1_9BACT|nr:GxxExxY protein [Candidatus Sungbacteria bacterium]
MPIAKLARKDLLYPDLSYKIIGILFEASNTLGHKYQERYYQRAVAALFRAAGVKFKEQVPVRFSIGSRPAAKGFMDFLIEDKIILEIKKGDRFLKHNVDQIYSYLKITGLQLGILANFISRGLQFKRIVNLYS